MTIEDLREENLPRTTAQVLLFRLTEQAYCLRSEQGPYPERSLMLALQPLVELVIVSPGPSLWRGIVARTAAIQLSSLRLEPTSCCSRKAEMHVQRYTAPPAIARKRPHLALCSLAPHSLIFRGLVLLRTESRNQSFGSLETPPAIGVLSSITPGRPFLNSRFGSANRHLIGRPGSTGMPQGASRTGYFRTNAGATVYHLRGPGPETGTFGVRGRARPASRWNDLQQRRAGFRPRIADRRGKTRLGV